MSYSVIKGGDAITEEERAKVVRILDAMQDWFSQDSHFCRGAYGHSVDGSECEDFELVDMATGHIANMCVVGARAHFAGSAYTSSNRAYWAQYFLGEASRALTPGSYYYPAGPVVINDKLGLEGVRKMIARARELALAYSATETETKGATT